jgi:hypothetical protein
MYGQAGQKWHRISLFSRRRKNLIVILQKYQLDPALLQLLLTVEANVGADDAILNIFRENSFSSFNYITVVRTKIFR